MIDTMIEYIMSVVMVSTGIGIMMIDNIHLRKKIKEFEKIAKK